MIFGISAAAFQWFHAEITDLLDWIFSTTLSISVKKSEISMVKVTGCVTHGNLDLFYNTSSEPSEVNCDGNGGELAHKAWISCTSVTTSLMLNIKYRRSATCALIHTE